MSSGARKTLPATYADLLALGEDFRGEIIGGEIVELASPTPAHCHTQAVLSGEIHSFNRRSGGRAPGGWWIVVDVDVEYTPLEVYRHDLSGWRRVHLPDLPDERPVKVCPDWVCEILSPSNWKRDTVDKLQTLQRHGVPYYWIVDLEHRVLTIYRYGAGVYELAGQAVPGQIARLPPFDALEIEVGVLFGDDPTEP